MFKKLVLVALCVAMLVPAHAARADTGPIQRLGTGIPTSIAASPDGKTLAVGSSIGVWFLDATTLAPTGFWDTGVWVDSVAYSVDGRYLQVNERVYEVASGSVGDAGEVIWVDHRCSFDEMQCIHLQIGHFMVKNMNTLVITHLIRQWYTLDVAWSLDGDKLYTVAGGSWNVPYALNVWDAHAWKATQQWADLTADMLSVRRFWSSEGTNATSSTPTSIRHEANRVYIYDQAASAVPRQFVPHHIGVEASAINSLQGVLVTSGVDNLRDCRRNTYGDYYYGCLTSDVSTRVWDIATFTQLAQLPSLFYDVGFSPDAGLIAGHTQTAFEVWDWRDSRKLWSADEKITGPYASFYAAFKWCWHRNSGVAFDSSGKFIATYSSPSSGYAKPQLVGAYNVQLYRLATGELITTFTGHTAPLTQITFSPDGTKVAASSCDGTVAIWPVP